MAYYLQMDGVDDYSSTPNTPALNVGSVFQITVVAAFKKTKGTWQIIAAKDSWSAGNGWYLYFQAGSSPKLQFNKAGLETWGVAFDPVVDQFYTVDVISDGTTWTLKVDGTTLATKAAVTIPDSTSTLHLGARHTNSGTGTADFFEGRIRSFKLIKNAVTSVHYDMTTQTVQDQSGNGNHATLTGGTWVDDGAGGGGSIIDAGTITISADGSLTSQASRVLTSNVTLQADTTFTANAQRILNGTSSIVAESDINVIASKILNGQSDLSADTNLNAVASRILNSTVNLVGDSSLNADADVLSIGITIDLSASSSLTAEGSKIIQGTSVLTANGEVFATGSIVLSGEAALSSDSELSLFIGDYYRQIIGYTLTITPEIQVETTISPEIQVETTIIRRKDFDLDV